MSRPSARHLVLLLAAAALVERTQQQGLGDGGTLGGQTCDVKRLEEFELLLEASGDYSGKGGSRRRRGRRLLAADAGGGDAGSPTRQLLQGLMTEQEPAVSAAGAPDWRTNVTCASGLGNINTEAALHVASAPRWFQAPAPTVHDQGDCNSW